MRKLVPKLFNLETVVHHLLKTGFQNVLDFEMVFQNQVHAVLLPEKSLTANTPARLTQNTRTVAI